MSEATTTGTYERLTTRQPVDASTVLVARDAPEGPQVFMLERTIESDFAGGAWVFPGGKVDDPDRDLDDDRWRGAAMLRAGRALGARDAVTALALQVAAVRETFEEAGLLLARHADGTAVTAEDLERPSYVETRAALNERGVRHDWRPWLASEGLVLDLDALRPFARWTTPHGIHRRFDTRFFLAVPPVEQTTGMSADLVEATAHRWTTPAGALAAHERGDVVLIFPTIHALRSLADSGASDVAGWWGLPGDLRPILPGISRDTDGQLAVHHPDGTDRATL